MRAFFPLLGLALAACGQLERDNPLDPRFEGAGEEGIQLIATFPEGRLLAGRLAEIRFAVSAPDLRTPVTGQMNLVGGRALAQVSGVPVGTGRVFRVEAFDDNLIRTFAAADTFAVEAGFPQVFQVEMQRLTGSIEITAALPPEITSLEVEISADGDTLRQTFAVSGQDQERIGGIPTGTDIRVQLTGRDATAQVLLLRELAADIREELVAHLEVLAEAGALQIVARFPPYVPIAAVDRFSDEAGTFYRRSDNPQLPGPGEPVDFDGAEFLLRGLGPNGEPIWFYNFDVKSTAPAPIYVLVDRFSNPLVEQLPIFDLLPGEPGYNDLWQVHQVHILDREYVPNTLSSRQALVDGGFQIEATDQVMHCVLAPAGSKASRRFDPATPAAAQDGWYRDQAVKYFLFEHPASTATVDFGGGRVNAPEMFAFFENDRDPREGFARDPLTGFTHNVITRLPGDEGYAPLWVLTVFKLEAFERVQSVANALDQANNQENLLILPELLYVNAPIVIRE